MQNRLCFAATAMFAGLAVSMAQAEHIPDGWAGYADGSGKTTTGGAGSPIVTVDNAEDLKKYCEAKTPVTIQVKGTIDLDGNQIYVRNDKTILGLGVDAVVIGGLKITRYDNQIVRNLTIRNSKGDGLTIQDARRVWIDHCTFIDAKDGQLDISHAADWITVSWCKFLYTADRGHNFVSLIGHSDKNGQEDTGTLHVTLHHNWWSTLCQERMPRVRFGRVHLYNNYYNAPGNNYCIRAALHSEILSEGNHFENADEPFEFFGDKGSRPPGKIRDVGSTLVNCTNIYAATDTVFTPPYAYKPDPVNQVPAIVQARAGAGKIPIRDDEGARPSTEGQSK